MSDHVYIRESSYSSISETTSQTTTVGNKTELSVGAQESTNAKIMYHNSDVHRFMEYITSDSKPPISIDTTEILHVSTMLWSSGLLHHELSK